MKIDNEEIARLMRVVSEPLRRNWERKMINGAKLEDIVASRENAIAMQKKCRRNCGFSLVLLMPAAGLLFGLLLDMAAHWAGFTLKLTLTSSAAVVFSIACIWSINHWIEKSWKMWRRIDECEKTLANFQSNVDALNPLGLGNTYHDVLTDAVVIKRIVGVAYYVVDAEDLFERLLKPHAIRSDIVHAGQWIEKCNEWFERIWTAATRDFALELNKSNVFAKAVHNFGEREKRLPAHLMK